jgi:hypothetical protein
MGGGMMMADCELCDGAGKFKEVSDDIDFLAMKQTESYVKAKKRLQARNEDLSDEEAEKLLDEAFEKEKPTVKRGRKKKEHAKEE